ncbi:MAG: 50S ribosomal protein L17 [Spirochaetes bacterium]|nr:50S ribosomal protein L17 [Spirochaetota bacterium]
MRHKNSVKQLGRTREHRRALFSNLATALFEHERIITTKQKAKELKRFSERLITRAKRNLFLSENDVAKKLHNKRQVMRYIHNRDVVKKLFDDIAPRYKERNGGYTRVYLLSKRREGDAAEMALIELVDRQPPVPKKKEKQSKGEKG